MTISRSDGVEFQNVAVTFADQSVNTNKKTTIKQTSNAETGFENIYTLKISADAPKAPAEGATLNGSYKGDLVMLFEPKI